MPRRKEPASILDETAPVAHDTTPGAENAQAPGTPGTPVPPVTDPAAILDAIRAVDPVALWELLASKAAEADAIRAKAARQQAEADAATQRKEERERLLAMNALAQANDEAEEKRRAVEAAVPQAKRNAFVAQMLARNTEATAKSDAAFAAEQERMKREPQPPKQ